jgi:dTDP-4-dehydrorhamnose reductase
VSADGARPTVVLGARGLVGRAVVATAPRDGTIVAAGRAELDITDAGAVRALLDAHRPSWVINCAAFTRVDAAEDDPQNVAANATAPGTLAAAARAVGARLLHISTDYVFDGTLGRPYVETDDVGPLSEYARAKLAGERGVANSGGGWLIVRSQWIYGEGGPGFVGLMRDRAIARAHSRVVSDQVGAPTAASELAGMIWALVRVDARGIVHATAAGSASRFEIARFIYERLGANPSLVTPCATADFPTRAMRPHDTRLDTSLLTKITGIKPRGWKEPLSEFLAR